MRFNDRAMALAGIPDLPVDAFKKKAAKSSCMAAAVARLRLSLKPQTSLNTPVRTLSG